MIVQLALNLGPEGDAAARGKAEALVDQLVKDKLAEIETARDASCKKPVRFLSVSEPLEEV
jgi:hypothetical protein